MCFTILYYIRQQYPRSFHLDEAAAELRQDIADLQGWMTYDNGEWVCSIDLVPLVWSRITYLRDIKARELREGLSSVYMAGRLEYANRLDNFFSCQAWSLTSAEIEEVKQVMLQHFPDEAELGELQENKIPINRGQS